MPVRVACIAYTLTDDAPTDHPGASPTGPTPPPGFVGNSPPMQAAYRDLAAAARTDAPVFLLGESGTGKDLAARAIHDGSDRKDGPYLAANCGAFPEALVDSVLFGHERGAYTGAEKRRKGLFELADGGTLLLDEITEMPAELQSRLLRVLEDGSTARLGGERQVEFNTRILAASNRELEDAVAEGSFREDLLYRLYVLPIRLPRLAERGGDLDQLVHAYLQDLQQDLVGDLRLDVTEEALAVLRRHTWPGNVRELHNVLQRAAILAEDGVIRAAHIRVVPVAGGPTKGLVEVGMTEADAVTRLFLATLESCGGDRKATARTLGISVKTVYNRLTALREKAPDELPAGV